MHRFARFRPAGITLLGVLTALSPAFLSAPGAPRAWDQLAPLSLQWRSTNNPMWTSDDPLTSDEFIWVRVKGALEHAGVYVELVVFPYFHQPPVGVLGLEKFAGLSDVAPTPLVNIDPSWDPGGTGMVSVLEPLALLDLHDSIWTGDGVNPHSTPELVHDRCQPIYKPGQGSVTIRRWRTDHPYFSQPFVDKWDRVRSADDARELMTMEGLIKLGILDRVIHQGHNANPGDVEDFWESDWFRNHATGNLAARIQAVYVWTDDHDPANFENGPDDEFEPDGLFGVISTLGSTDFFRFEYAYTSGAGKDYPYNYPPQGNMGQFFQPGDPFDIRARGILHDSFAVVEFNGSPVMPMITPILPGDDDDFLAATITVPNRPAGTTFAITGLIVDGQHTAIPPAHQDYGAIAP